METNARKSGSEPTPLAFEGKLENLPPTPIAIVDRLRGAPNGASKAEIIRSVWGDGVEIRKVLKSFKVHLHKARKATKRLGFDIKAFAGAGDEPGTTVLKLVPMAA